MADRTVSSICSVLCVCVGCPIALLRPVTPFVSAHNRWSFRHCPCFFSVQIYLSFSFAQEQFEWFGVGSLLGCPYLGGYLGANIKQLKQRANI